MQGRQHGFIVLRPLSRFLGSCWDKDHRWECFLNMVFLVLNRFAHFSPKPNTVQLRLNRWH